MRKLNGLTATLLIGAALLSAVISSATDSPGTAQTYTIVIKGSQFVPALLRLAPNDTVIWTNADIVPHTVNATKAFDSKNLAPGQSWRFVAKKKGEFNYACSYHPTMLGVLIVQ